jgi:hypothetical protein
MDESLSITPPPELVQQWADMLASRSDETVFSLAAHWGADQELEACCHLLTQQGFDFVDDLRAARRPKPPSLKERALKALDDISIASFEQDAANTIRRALEQLDD